MADKTIKFSDKEVAILLASLNTQIGVFERAATKASRDIEETLKEYYVGRINECHAVRSRFLAA